MSPGHNTLPFVKANACGNDFLLIEGTYAPADIAAFSQRVCDRHSGVGADGVEWMFPPSDGSADVRAQLFNADGSEAEISGNGTRCVAAYISSEQHKEKVVVQTAAGVKTCKLISYNGARYEFEISMGEPQVGDEFPLKLAVGEVRGTPVSMGNPHYVVFVKEFATGWQVEAAEIGRNQHFKHGVNVEFVVTKDQHNLEVRFFERGVGETQSSGTGSCASAVAAIATQRAESPLRVHAAGGAQTVRWDGQVFLRGPAEIICRGEFFV